MVVTRKNTSQGFSLIELMLAISISILIVLALQRILLLSINSYRDNYSRSQLNEVMLRTTHFIRLDFDHCYEKNCQFEMHENGFILLQGNQEGGYVRHNYFIKDNRLYLKEDGKPSIYLANHLDQLKAEWHAAAENGLVILYWTFKLGNLQKQVQQWLICV
jgi:type II secretory pathway pseudopilin PulG